MTISGDSGLSFISKKKREKFVFCFLRVLYHLPGEKPFFFFLFLSPLPSFSVSSQHPIFRIFFHRNNTTGTDWTVESETELWPLYEGFSDPLPKKDAEKEGEAAQRVTDHCFASSNWTLCSVL